MMSSVKLTAILTPPEPTARDGNALRAARREEAAEIVAALERELGTAITMVECTLDQAPSHGLIVVFDEAIRDYASLGPRTILINAKRSSVPELLEQLQLCAAIEAQSYFQWRSRKGVERGYGLLGRRDIAARIDARFGKAAGYPPETENYGMLASDRCRDLPSLLATYLKVYVGRLAPDDPTGTLTTV